MTALVVIPTYDELASLPTVLDRLLAADPRLHVLVVDDGSPDGTGDYAAGRAAKEPRLHVLRRAEKQGLGAAYRAGFAWGMARGYDALVEMDADLSHPPELVPVLLGALGGADVAIGSRYVTGGSVRNWPLRRRLLSRGGNAYVRAVLGMTVRDVTAGFRAYRREVLETLPIADIVSNGYVFQVETTHRARQAGFVIVEVPITFTERTTGVSKMHSGIVGEALLRVLSWSLHGGRRRPARPNARSVATPPPIPAREAA